MTVIKTTFPVHGQHSFCLTDPTSGWGAAGARRGRAVWLWGLTPELSCRQSSPGSCPEDQDPELLWELTAWCGLCGAALGLAVQTLQVHSTVQGQCPYPSPFDPIEDKLGDFL